MFMNSASRSSCSLMMSTSSGSIAAAGDLMLALLSAVYSHGRHDDTFLTLTSTLSRLESGLCTEISLGLGMGWAACTTDAVSMRAALALVLRLGLGLGWPFVGSAPPHRHL
ncbi:hypothetical protein AYL99_11689 [Fonsecaea erecta]|uniref:Uncharacterized protein n=1 Tax=Fonsecaea erecta TaxID=1367422 RepID=A0A178Z382_9EURO|nr:hypothetical protein AYL99_11689 [Fonsecaea erecta]OAP54154.1 hypothetical protein AYL99_11689 [Fonsecaea erecta]